MVVPLELPTPAETHGTEDARCWVVPLSDDTSGRKVDDGFAVPLFETCGDTNEDNGEE